MGSDVCEPQTVCGLLGDVVGEAQLVPLALQVLDCEREWVELEVEWGEGGFDSVVLASSVISFCSRVLGWEVGPETVLKSLGSGWR